MPDACLIPHFHASGHYPYAVDESGHDIVICSSSKYKLGDYKRVLELSAWNMVYIYHGLYNTIGTSDGVSICKMPVLLVSTTVYSLRSNWARSHVSCKLYRNSAFIFPTKPGTLLEAWIIQFCYCDTLVLIHGSAQGRSSSRYLASVVDVFPLFA